MLNRRQVVVNGASALLAGGLRQRAPVRIDSHVHVWKEHSRFPFAEGANVPPGDASVEKLLQLMAANGVARTVLIQVIHYRWDNSYLADVLKRHPGKFQGVCRVDPMDPAAPDTLSKLTAQGFCGVRLSPAANESGDWISGPLMKPLWSRCVALKVPMTLLIPASRLPQVVPLLESNPELTVVIDHMADCPLDRPDLLAGLLALARYPKVFVKISHLWSLSKQAYPYRDALEQVKKLRDHFGAARLMWGTDWPIAPELLGYSERVKLYDEQLSFLNDNERADVLYRTVQRVWPFGLS